MPLCISCRGEYQLPDENNQETKAQNLVSPTSPLSKKDQEEAEQLPSEVKSPLSEQEQETRTPLLNIPKLPQPEEDQESRVQPPVDTMPHPAEEKQHVEPQRVATCPSSQPLSNLPQVCGFPEPEPFICTRCKQDNKHWDEWINAGLGEQLKRFFLNSWGVLAFIPFLLLLILMRIDFLPTTVKSIGISTAALLNLLAIFAVYNLRHSLWQRDRFAKFKQDLRPSSALLGIIAFALVVVFGVATITLLGVRVNALEAGLTEVSIQSAIAILLAMAFLCMTLAIMLIATYIYGESLNREMPLPIYTQERRLLCVIGADLGARIQRATSKSSPVETTIIEMERTPEGGIRMMINAGTDVDQEAGKEPLRRLDNWRVVTDRWGYIKEMRTEGIPKYVIVEKKDAAGADNGTKTDETKSELTKENGLLPGSECMTRSDTMISIISHRRHSMR